MVRFVGLDVHKRVIEVCILDGAGKIVLRCRLDATREAIETFARTHLTKEDQVALEATTNTWAVVRLLKPFVAKVVVSNPLRTKAIAQAKVKTDKVDAEVLAQLLRCDYLPDVWEPPEDIQQMRQLTARRSSLVSDRIRIKNRIQSTLAQRLMSLPGKDRVGPSSLAWLREVKLDDEARLAVDSELRLLDAVEKEIAALDVVLAKKAWQDDRVRLLMTLPGVDVAVAEALLAALGEVKRFRDADHAAAYLGLAPSTKQSAEHCYHGPITKAGNTQARWMLVQAAHHVAAHPGPLGVFFRRLAKKKNYNVAIVATARKLAVISWHMLSKNEPYRYALPQRTELKLQHLRVKATGRRRKSGPKPGTRRVAKLQPGTKSRTIKTLAQVLAEEGLPMPGLAPAGESRTIAQTGTRDFVASLERERVVAAKKEEA
jgi:transposase